MRSIVCIIFFLLPCSTFAYIQTVVSGAGGGRPSTVLTQFTHIPAPLGDGLLTVSGMGDIGGANEVVRVDLVPGGFVGYVFGDLNNGHEPIPEIDTLLIPRTALESAISNGTLTVALIVEPNSGVSSVGYNYLRLEVPAVPEPSSVAMTIAGLMVIVVMRESGRRRKM